MRYYLFFVCLAIAAKFDCVLSDGPDGLPEFKVLQKCKQKTNASQGAYELFMKQWPDLDSSREGKCFLHCAMETIGLMREDGSMDNDKARSLFAKVYIGDLDKILGFWKICHGKEEIGANKCEKSYRIFKCFFTDIRNIEEETRRMGKVDLENCRKETNATEEDEKKFFIRQDFSDTSRELKCFVKCFMEKLGIMESDGSITIAKIKILLSRVFAYTMLDGMFDESDDSWKTCQTKVSKDDRCNYAYEVVKCLSVYEKQKQLRKSSGRQ